MEEWFEKRAKFTHHNLMEEMMERSPADYRNYFRMENVTFMELLEMVTPYIQKSDSHEKFNSFHPAFVMYKVVQI